MNRMKIFLIGGNVLAADEPDFDLHDQCMRTAAAAIGKSICMAGHDLLLCSGFPGSADFEAVSTAMKVLTTNAKSPARIEFYYPNCMKVASQIESILTASDTKRVSRFPQATTLNESEELPSTYDWLVAQLVAMDSCNAVVALGGKTDGTASVLLRLAESIGKPILPFAFLGGASGQSFHRLQYRLKDKLGDRVSGLVDPSQTHSTVEFVETLCYRGFHGKTSADRPRFFISYPRARPQEADFVEMVLRRRGYVVYRDERDFGPGQMLQGEIEGYIHQATVFIALWCQDYACSPWCFDELELALELQQDTVLEVWLFCLDDTRIVPKNARNIVSYPAVSRNELEGHIVSLLENVTEDES